MEPPPPPFMDGIPPMSPSPDGFSAAGSSWMPNTTIPPPLPLQAQTSSQQFDGNNQFEQSSQQNHQENGEVTLNMKKRKKEKSGKAQVYTSRPWNREDAEKALALEKECQRSYQEQSLVIRFPDPELSKDIVKRFHPFINSVHFQAPSGARFCLVQLVEGANVDKVITDLEKIKFGTGKVKAERIKTKNEEPVTPEAIDPYTLYVGNLPTNISTQLVKEKFSTALRIDIGYAAKIKYTRYAFIQYRTPEAAMEAYKSAVNTQIESRSIILRFRRHKRPVGPPGESQSVHLKTIPKVPKIKTEKEDHEEEEDDEDDDDDDDDDDDKSSSKLNMKKRKKEKSGRASRPWNREDAEKALALENECQRSYQEQSLVIRFPDPELSKDIVKRFHPFIHSVNFQAPRGARFCFAQLVEGANVDKVITDLEKIKFGTGKVNAERIQTKNEEPVTPEAIDPYTLYVANLPINNSAQLAKEKFPTAQRIDIGYAAKMKYTRYAFIQYGTPEAAMEAYKSAVNTEIESRLIILRFRRHKRPLGPPGESPSVHLVLCVCSCEERHRYGQYR